MYSDHSRNNYPRYEHDLEQPLYESSIYPDRYENTSLRQESFNHELVNPNPQYQGRDVIIPHSAINDFELHDKTKRAIDNHIEGTFDQNVLKIVATPEAILYVGDEAHHYLGGDMHMRFEGADVIEKD